MLKAYRSKINANSTKLSELLSLFKKADFSRELGSFFKPKYPKSISYVFPGGKIWLNQSMCIFGFDDVS